MNYKRKFGKFGTVSKAEEKQRLAEIKRERIVKPWSDLQKNIFAEIANGSGHICVDAVPGSGKTTTIIEALYHVPENFRKNHDVLFCAFNTSIAKEIERRIPLGVQAKTIHSLGFDIVKQEWATKYKLNRPGSVDTTNSIVNALAGNFMGYEKERFFQRNALVRAVSLAKATMSLSKKDIEAMLIDYNVDIADATDVEFTNYIHSIINATMVPNKLPGTDIYAISFDDMTWLPNIYDWEPHVKYSRIFIDEAQDLSKARSAIVLRYLKKDGRVCAVGDENQAIFGFAGSDMKSIPNLISRLNATTLPLSVSYRCPKKVVEKAKKINPKIEYAEDSIDGTVTDLAYDKVMDEIRNGDVLISRKNAPLIRACLRIVSSGKRANIQGRDIGDRLIWRIKNLNPSSVNDLKLKMEKVKESISEKGSQRALAMVTDEIECINALCENINSIEEAVKKIDSIFDDRIDDDIIKLSTVHRFKGLERDRVFLLNDTFMPYQSKDEDNIIYTALTRTKKELFLVSGVPMVKKDDIMLSA